MTTEAEVPVEGVLSVEELVLFTRQKVQHFCVLGVLLLKNSEEHRLPPLSREVLRLLLPHHQVDNERSQTLVRQVLS